MPQEKKLTERTLSGFFFLITGSGIQVLLKIGVLAILARLVSPKEFGVVGLALIIVEFSKMFTQMGVGPAIVQRTEIEDRHLRTGFTLSILMGIFFSCLLLLLAPVLANFFRMPGLTPVLRVISLVFLVDSSTLIGQALLQRNMRFKTSASIELISYTLGYGGIGIFLGYLGWGVWALVAAHIFQALLHAILLVLVQPFPKRPGFDPEAFKELLHFGGGMTLGRLGNFLAVQGDNIVVGRTLGAVALGIYGRAYQFMVMPAGLFGNALDKALFPAMAKVQEDKQKLGKAYLTGVSMIALVSIPLSIAMFFLAPEIVLILLGPKWIEVVMPFQLLACSLLFRMSYKMSDTLARATGAVYNRAWRQIIYAVLVFIGAYTGHYWGLYGVAIGVAFAVLVNFLLMAHLSLQLAALRWLDMVNAHWPGLIVGVPVGAVCLVLLRFCRSNLDSALLTLFITGSGIVLVTVVLLKYFPNLIIRDELKDLYANLILKKLKKFSASSKPKQPLDLVKPFPKVQKTHSKI